MMEHNTSVRPATERLVDKLVLDLPMDPPLITDFGIDSDDHYRALRAVLFNEHHAATPEEAEKTVNKRMQFLDDAHGNGPRLNALVKLYAPEYADHVKFETSWDVIYGRTGAAAEQLQQEAEQQYGRWDHHHPDDVTMLKEIQDDLRGMKEEHEAIAKERRAMSEAERKPLFSRDGRDQFFGRSTEEQQQEPVQEHEPDDGLER